MHPHFSVVRQKITTTSGQRNKTQGEKVLKVTNNQVVKACFIMLL